MEINKYIDTKLYCLRVDIDIICKTLSEGRGTKLSPHGKSASVETQMHHSGDEPPLTPPTSVWTPLMSTVRTRSSVDHLTTETQRRVRVSLVVMDVPTPLTPHGATGPVAVVGNWCPVASAMWNQ